MFDEEAPTISLDRSEAFEVILTGPLEVGFDTTPVEALPLDDTAVAVLQHPAVTLEKQTTDKMLVPVDQARASTDADWPPEPREPGERRFRHAGVYKAITSVSKVIKLTD